VPAFTQPRTGVGPLTRGWVRCWVEFAADVLDVNGAVLQRLAGDLTPFLIPAQVTGFTNAALALYAQARANCSHDAPHPAPQPSPRYYLPTLDCAGVRRGYAGRGAHQHPPAGRRP
jgi:hypothetical protein